MELIGMAARMAIWVADFGHFLMCLDFLRHLFYGSIWLVSPSYRKKVKQKEEYQRVGIYLGAIFTPPLLIFISILILT